MKRLMNLIEFMIFNLQNVENCHASGINTLGIFSSRD
jgi:hypothetical protein